jgi:hypothetical protein
MDNQIRNPKHETRTKFKCPMTEIQKRKMVVAYVGRTNRLPPAFGSFPFRILNLFRISELDIRISRARPFPKRLYVRVNPIRSGRVVDRVGWRPTLAPSLADPSLKFLAMGLLQTPELEPEERASQHDEPERQDYEAGQDRMKQWWEVQGPQKRQYDCGDRSQSEER